ncbi:MAG: sarcosine oxidase subunit delta [Hyphomicrobiaceae bacterium]
MRIPCPYCGPRGHEEFTCLGDATRRRPDESDPQNPADAAAWQDFVHLRANPAGLHRELWQHVAGCRQWLVVTRDTRTHEITAVAYARAVARSSGGVS